MEEFFCPDTDFFAQICRRGQGQKAHFCQKGRQIGQAVAQPEGKAAQEQEVEHPAAEETQHQVDAYLPVVRPHRVGEQGGHGKKPEKQVQYPAQGAPFDPGAQDPKGVVKHSQGRAKGHGAQKGPELGGVVYLHSREKKPPLSRLSS